MDVLVPREGTMIPHTRLLNKFENLRGQKKGSVVRRPRPLGGKKAPGNPQCLRPSTSGAYFPFLQRVSASFHKLPAVGSALFLYPSSPTLSASAHQRLSSASLLPAVFATIPPGPFVF